jgi:hypothetical protein
LCRGLDTRLGEARKDAGVAVLTDREWRPVRRDRALAHDND